MTSADRALGAFHSLHARPPAGVWSAPGRVNLIGEHTDYNDGFVLPFALPHRTAVAASPRDDGRLAVTSIDSRGRPQHAPPVPVAELRPGLVTGWAAYPAGVAWVLRDHGPAAARVADGADLVIAGDVPVGAGLSSSAALECAVALALLGLAGVPVTAPTVDPIDDPTDVTRPDGTRPGVQSPGGAPVAGRAVATWAQQAENEFVGVPTGVLDQTASLCCTAGHALFLDVRSGATDQVPLDLGAMGRTILVIDTRAQHALAESGYADRRAGCEQAADLLGVAALRDVAEADLPAALRRLPEHLRPLVRHVVTENARVLAAVAALRHDEPDALGALLTSSHRSLRDDYRVSCRELDLAVDTALTAGALGARMTGGGFGGSAIALVRRDDQDAVAAAVRAAFAADSLTAPQVFPAVPAPGAGRDR